MPRRALCSIFGLAAMLTATASPTLAANATDLGVRLTAVSFRNGSVGLYTVSVTNNGPGATDDVITLSLDLPAGFSLLSASGGEFTCTGIDNDVTCTRSTALGSGRTATIKLRTNVCSRTTRVSTVVRVSYAGDTNSANNRSSRGTSVRLGPCAATPTPTRTPTVPTATATPVGPIGTPTRTLSPSPSATATSTATPIPVVADLSLSMSAVTGFRVGSTGTYRVLVTNNDAAATNLPLIVTNDLPNGLDFVSSTGSGWTCSASGRSVRCQFAGSLAGNSNTSFLLNLAVGSAAAPSTTNTAALGYAGDPDLTNNQVRRPTTVRF